MTIRNANPDDLDRLADLLHASNDGGAYGSLSNIFDRARTHDVSGEVGSLQPLLHWLTDAADQLRNSATILRGVDPGPGTGAFSSLDLETQLLASSWQVNGQDLADEFAGLTEKDSLTDEDLRWMNQILMDYGEDPDFAGYLVDEIGMDAFLGFSQRLDQRAGNAPEDVTMVSMLQSSLGTTLSRAFWTPGEMTAQVQTAPGYEDSAYQEWLETPQGQRYDQRLQAFNELGTQQLYAEETQMSPAPDERLAYDVALDLFETSGAPLDEHFFDRTMTSMMELERADLDVWNVRRYEPDDPDTPGWNSDNDVVDRLLGLAAASNPDAVATFFDPRLGRHNLDYFTGEGDSARDAGIATEDGESPGLDAALLAAGLGGLFATSSTPQQNKDWWDGLGEQTQEALIRAFPERVGAMDGLPTVDRDSANRIVLEAEYDRLNALLGNDLLVDRDRQAMEDKLAGVSDIRERLNRNGSPETFLLAFNPEGDGQYIVANGNPDTADHTAVYVPGTGAALAGANGDMRRANDLWRVSDSLTDGDVSTITWLGYDAPDDVIPDAGFESYARDAAPVFVSFTEGLAVAQGGEGESHTTIIGHSYGSTVVGAASQEGGLFADDVIAAGSPGMLVDHASDLGVGSDHVWSMAASIWEDQVPLAGLIHGGGGFDVDAEVGPFGIPYLDFDILPEVPSMESFGGNIMSNDSSGHSDYWDVDDEGNASLSLLNQARVIVGEHGDVT
ncbi:alpha/beta hydrolase [Streptomyces sp. B6B3]|uniref:alpha/beta hydrolase n=1 Tax=Streptomyces sp. B6B3 TaxID=3153570 RepID=UPI00325EF8B7